MASNQDLFEQNLMRVSTSEYQKKMTRRSTKVVDGTILNRHKDIVCMVSE
jgi:hypothetical protein